MENCKDGIILRGSLRKLVIIKNIKVDLLIGANCLEALEPLEVIPSQDKGPYAFEQL